MKIKFILILAIVNNCYCMENNKDNKYFEQKKLKIELQRMNSMMQKLDLEKEKSELGELSIKKESRSRSIRETIGNLKRQESLLKVKFINEENNFREEVLRNLSKSKIYEIKEEEKEEREVGKKQAARTKKVKIFFENKENIELIKCLKLDAEEILNLTGNVYWAYFCKKLCPSLEGIDYLTFIEDSVVGEIKIKIKFLIEEMPKVRAHEIFKKIVGSIDNLEKIYKELSFSTNNLFLLMNIKDLFTEQNLKEQLFNKETFSKNIRTDHYNYLLTFLNNYFNNKYSKDVLKTAHRFVLDIYTYLQKVKIINKDIINELAIKMDKEYFSGKFYEEASKNDKFLSKILLAYREYTSDFYKCLKARILMDKFNDKNEMYKIMLKFYFCIDIIYIMNKIENESDCSMNFHIYPLYSKDFLNFYIIIAKCLETKKMIKLTEDYYKIKYSSNNNDAFIENLNDDEISFLFELPISSLEALFFKFSIKEQLKDKISYENLYKFAFLFESLTKK